MNYPINNLPIFAITLIILTGTLFGCGQQKALIENDAPIAAPPAIPPAVTHTTEDVMAPKLPGTENAKLAPDEVVRPEEASDDIGVESSTINTPTVSRPVRTPVKKVETTTETDETTAAKSTPDPEQATATPTKQPTEKTPASTTKPKETASPAPSKSQTDIDLPPMLNNTKKPAPTQNIDLKNATITTPSDN